MSLKGCSYVLTGGASEIGLATTKKLLQQSATVHVIDHASMLPEIGRHAENVWYYPSVDVSSRAEMKTVFQQVLERSPSLTGLVNCAGIFGPSPLATNEEADRTARKIMDVNLWGTWNAGTEFLVALEGAKASGRPGQDSRASSSSSSSGLCIVNVASMAAVRGMPGMAAYVASKHAVIGLTKAWSQEYGCRGVRVNAVAPGMIRTPVVAKEAMMTEGGRHVSAMKRVGEPDEVAGTIMFLLSESSSYISGQVIEISGGWT